MKMRSLADKGEILAVLETDRIYAAYAIGDLVPGLFEQCRWSIAENDTGACALTMTFAGFEPPALFIMGSIDGLQALFRQGTCPPAAYVTMRPEHMDVVSGVYHMTGSRHMWRMSVDRQTFQPVCRPTVRLHAGDIAALNALYAWGGGAFFADYQLEQGVYYAAQVDGQLVAAAGTHVVAPEYNIAAVGNVYTHPRFRNRGFATACTSAVVAELLDRGCSTVVLSVWQDNAPAIHAYHKLGFRVHCPFIETRGQVKSGIAQLSTLLRRRLING